MVFSSQIKIISKYNSKFNFVLINVHLKENYRIFVVLCSTFLVFMSENVTILKVNIFVIRAF